MADYDVMVLNMRDEVIRGLYAAGETTGGVLGEREDSVAGAIVQPPANG